LQGAAARVESLQSCSWREAEYCRSWTVWMSCRLSCTPWLSRRWIALQQQTGLWLSRAAVKNTSARCGKAELCCHERRLWRSCLSISIRRSTFYLTLPQRGPDGGRYSTTSANTLRGALARVLSTPLMISMARSVYRDPAHDPKRFAAACRQYRNREAAY